MFLRPKKFFLFRFKRKAFFLTIFSALFFSWAHFNVSSFFLEILAPFSEIPRFFESQSALNVQIQSLQKENARLALEILRFQALENEWLHIQNLLSFDPFIKPGTITKVISVNHDTKTALIAMGSKQGIKPGMFVLNAQGIVGKIETVSAEVSRIIFLTHPHFKASVLGQEGREHCIVSGNDQDCLLLVYRQTVNPLKRGEALLLSQYNQNCPAGYLVGYWSEKKGGVVPAVSMDQLDYVRVLLPDDANLDIFLEL